MTLKEMGQRLVYINALRRTAIWRAGGPEGACRGQMRALHCITHHPGCGQKDIADDLHISPAAVADICKRLEHEGLISRQVDPCNRRCKILLPTPKGEAADRRHGEIFRQVEEQTFAHMTEEELDTLGVLLDKILDNLGGNREDPIQILANLEEKDREKTV